LVATLNATLVQAVSYAAFLLILAVLGAWPGTQALACFGLLAAVAVFALGIGLVASVLNIYFRDVGQVVSVGLQFLFWFTPIVYPYSILRDADSPLLARIGFLMNFNPLAHFTRTSQWLFGGAGGEAWFSWTSVGVVILGPALALAAGLALFHRFRRDMMDNL
jgi:lipopolysaccharide transport system permease protein